jgi:PIN domain nuclease of toxin-antitoxin system
MPPADYIPSRMAALGNLSLPVTQTHVLGLAALPLHHKDPFDRILIAQALTEELHLLTADPAMRMYEVPIIWATQ